MVKESYIDVEPKHLKLIKKILKRHITYKTVWAYGSRVNWTANQYSDLDLVVFEVSTVKLGELKEDFTECDLPFSVDIVLWEKIPENFKNKILEKYVALQKQPELEGWKECRLGDVASKIGSGATPRGGSNVYKDFGVSLIRSQNVLDFEFSRSGLVFIDDSQANGLKNVEIQENDVLLNITGDSVARCCIVPNNILPARVNQHVSIIRLNPELADYKFVFYSVLYLKDELLMQAEIGATRKALTKGMVENLEIFIPPLPEQKTIASVLSSLDDKIDLLHRQNKTLEAMAETLFRQWFVPARAGEPHAGGEEAKEDWINGQLGDVLDLVYGKGLKEEIRTGKGFPVVGSSGVVGYHSDFLVEGPGIVIGRKGTLGKVIYIFKNFFPIDTTYYIKSKVNSVGLFYEYFLLKSLNFEDMNSDLAVPGLNRDIALSTEIKIAPLDKLKEFNQYSSTFLKKLNSNNNQIRILEKLRDTLLPKLMSGEVRVQFEED